MLSEAATVSGATEELAYDEAGLEEAARRQSDLAVVSDAPDQKPRRDELTTALDEAYTRVSEIESALAPCLRASAMVTRPPRTPSRTRPSPDTRWAMRDACRSAWRGSSSA